MFQTTNQTIFVPILKLILGCGDVFFRNCRWFDRNVHGNFTHEYEDINKDKLIIDLLWMFNEHGDWWGQKPGNLVWTILGRGQIRTLNGGDNSFLLVSMECSLGQTVVGSLVVTTNAWFEPTGWWFQSLWKIWKSVGMILHNIWKVIQVMFQTTNQMWNQSRFGMFCILQSRGWCAWRCPWPCWDASGRTENPWGGHAMLPIWAIWVFYGFLCPQTFISIFWLHPTLNSPYISMLGLAWSCWCTSTRLYLR